MSKIGCKIIYFVDFIGSRLGGDEIDVMYSYWYHYPKSAPKYNSLFYSIQTGLVVSQEEASIEKIKKDKAKSRGQREQMTQVFSSQLQKER